MQDGAHRRVVRIGEIGDTVRRPVQPWTPTVHALLRHLAEVGFTYAPQPLGIDNGGCEVLTYIEGDSGQSGWAKVVGDHGLRNFAGLLRDYHDACRSFSPPPGANWSTDAGSPGHDEVIFHIRRTHVQGVCPGGPCHHVRVEDLVRSAHVQRRRLTVLAPADEDV
ncbi:hypothetical protein [Streptomyces sp. NPDC007355]|uniref:hypothetical protein n=1 Tax=Streptomyces sp. NPDC007355 TaxID=3364778 RepID=UPI003678A4FE